MQLVRRASFALLVLAALAAPGVAPATEIAFTMPVRVSETEWAFEPSLAVAPDGALYVAWPTGFPIGETLVFRETPTGFEDVTPPRFVVGGGDSDVVFGPDGRLYVTDLWLGSITVFASDDGGAAWDVSNPIASGTIADDRMWLAVDGEGTVYLSYNQLETGYWVARSNDGGRTFLPMLVAPAGMYPPGPMVVAEGVVAFGHSAPIAGNVAGIFGGVGPLDFGVYVTRSTDRGQTWETVRVAQLDAWGQNMFPSLAADAAGTLYLVWSEGIAAPRNPLRYSFSTDGGASWSAPRTIPMPTGTALLPWATSGAPGSLGVAFIHSPTTNSAATAVWHVRYAMTSDATAALPAWSGAQVSVDPAMSGPISGRPPIGDFLTARALADGGVAVAWAEEIGDADLRAMLAKQVAGPRLG